MMKLGKTIELKNNGFMVIFGVFGLSTRYNRIFSRGWGVLPDFRRGWGWGTPKIKHDSKTDSGLAQWWLERMANQENAISQFQ